MPAPARDRAAIRATLVAAVLGSALGFIDFGAVGVILPSLQREFATDVGGLQWVVSATALFLSALLLVGGALGDRFGRRRVFMLGVGLFALAASAAGAAPTLPLLLAARAVQGVGAALLVPGSLALIAANVPEKEHGRAFGMWAAMSGLMAAGAPAAAGWLAQTFSWRWVFWAYAPIAGIVLLALARVPESKAKQVDLDLPGAGLATVALGGLAFGLIEGNRSGFAGSPAVLGALLMGAAATVAFVQVERRAASPMLPLGLFRDRVFAGANLATLLVYAALSGALFFVPLNLIQLQGYTPAEAGAAGIPFALLLTVLSVPAGWARDRFGPRVLMTVGPVVTAAGFVAFARVGVGGSYWTTFFPGYVLVGVGMAALIAPLTATVMNAAPSGRRGIASGINNAVARTAGLLAVAAFGIVAVQVFAGALPEAALAAVDPRDLAGAPTQDAATRAAVEGAFVAAFRSVMLLSAALCVAGAVTAAFTAPPGGARAASGDE